MAKKIKISEISNKVRAKRFFESIPEAIVIYKKNEKKDSSK